MIAAWKLNRTDLIKSWTKFFIIIIVYFHTQVNGVAYNLMTRVVVLYVWFKHPLIIWREW